VKDFLDQLDERLSLIAHDLATDEQTPAGATRKRSRKRPAFLGGLTAALAAAAALVAMTGTSMADLAILTTPTTDASELRPALSAADDAGVDFTKAHAFGTAGGPGYVLASPKLDALCIAVPDPGTPGDYGQTCAGPLASVERDGLSTLLLGQGVGATNTVAFVLPDGAKDVRLRVGGESTRPPIESGVLVAVLREAAVVSWTVDGRPAHKAFRGPSAQTGIAFACPDGRAVTAPLRADGSAPSQKALRARCDR
jgi:hypothetical protein